MTKTTHLAISAAIVSAVVHASLVPQHAASEPLLAAAFITATIALVVAAALLYARGGEPVAAGGTALLFVALIGSYILDRTVGLPLARAHETMHAAQLDTLGLATKAIEAIGAFAAVSLLFRHEPVRVRSDPPA